MSLNLDRSTWKRVTFGDVATASKERCDPTDGSVDRYIAGEHMDTDELKIRRWGEVGDGYLGPAFHRAFHPGQVLYGSRRTYLRKVAVAEFDGVCANTTFVVESKDTNVLLPEFLPFVMTSEPFHAFAISESKGSVNPYVNWSDIARYEFDLPPLDDQRRIADLLWAVESHSRVLAVCSAATIAAEATWTSKVFADFDWSRTIRDVLDPSRPLCYGVVQPGVHVENGVGLLRVADLEVGDPVRTDVKRIAAEIDRQYTRSRVSPGDVLVSVVGTIGRTWIVTEEFSDFNIARALARLSPDPRKMDPSFLVWILSSAAVQAELERAAFESARKTLNLSALANVVLPNSPIPEQELLLRTRSTFLTAKQQADNEAATLREFKEAILADIFGDAE